LRNYYAALVCFDTALELDPTSTDAWYFEGVIYSGQNEYGLAVKCLSKASQLSPLDALVWRDLGSALFMSGNPKKAVSAYYKALALDPSLNGVWNALGNVVASDGDFVHAAEFFHRATQGNPQDAYSWHNYAMALIKLKKYDEALEAISIAIAQDPNNEEFAHDHNRLTRKIHTMQHGKEEPPKSSKSFGSILRGTAIKGPPVVHKGDSL